MHDAPTFSERSALSDTRTSASAIVLVLVLSIRALLTPGSWVPLVLLGIALLSALSAWWFASNHYIWREREDTRLPRPWIAFTAAGSVALSSVAGLMLAWQDVPGLIDLVVDAIPG